MSTSEMSDSEKHLVDPYGDHTRPQDRTQAQEMSRYNREVTRQQEQAGRSGSALGSDSGTAWVLTMLVLPYFLIVAVAFYWLMIIGAATPTYRRVLTAVLPSSWFADRIGEPGSSNAVAGVVLGTLIAILVGTLLLRRMIGRRWAARTGGPAFLWLAGFTLSSVFVVGLILTPGLVLMAGSVAAGAGTEAEAGRADPVYSLRAWPVTLTVLTAMWWSIGTTRRFVRRAKRRRYAGWVEGPDGLLYPPAHGYADASRMTPPTDAPVPPPSALLSVPPPTSAPPPAVPPPAAPPFMPPPAGPSGAPSSPPPGAPPGRPAG